MEIIILVILVIVTVFITSALTAMVLKSVASRKYWKGRLEGWQACENMAINRAKEHGYDMDKFLTEILQ